MIETHYCEMTNDLGQSMKIIEEYIWLFDSHDNFWADFDVNFCPVCGKRVKEKENEMGE